MIFTLNTALFSQERTGTLSISLTDFDNNEGKAMLALYDTEDNFDKSEAFRRAKVEIIDNKAEIVFKDISRRKLRALNLPMYRCTVFSCSCS